MNRFFKPIDSKEQDEGSGGIKRARVTFNIDDVISDPGMRRPINEFDVNIRDQVRREYLLRGPCQPIGHNYPRRQYGKEYRCFQSSWFDKYKWLEYSISKDAAYCLWCYLFRTLGSRPQDEAFSNIGVTNWKNALEKFTTHVGKVGGAHSDSVIELQSFQNQRQSIQHLVQAHSSETEIAYRIRLTAALDVTRILLKQGLAFRGHDESIGSLSRGNYLEILEWYTRRNKDIAKKMNENAPRNSQMTSPKVQKELTNACANEVTKVILSDIGDKVFSLMVDESRDVSTKEQMGVVLRYVNNQGHIIERFLSVVHVPNTSSISLKYAIDSLFSKHKLSISKLRGQGYDGASNMLGEYNRLKALILRENSAARYVHCFAHQLQLVVVSVAKSNRFVSEFFNYLGMIVNVTGGSCKRKEMTKQLEHDRLLERLEKGKIVSGKGKTKKLV